MKRLNLKAGIIRFSGRNRRCAIMASFNELRLTKYQRPCSLRRATTPSKCHVEDWKVSIFQRPNAIHILRRLPPKFSRQSVSENLALKYGSFGDIVACGITLFLMLQICVICSFNSWAIQYCVDFLFIYNVIIG